MMPEAKACGFGTFEEARATLRRQIAGFEPPLRKQRGRRRAWRFEAELAPLDSLGWLSLQSFSVRSYWKDRETPEGRWEYAGVGLAWQSSADEWAESAVVWRQAASVSAALRKARVYAGMCFHGSLSGSEWESFRSIRFWVPRFELGIDQGRCFLACNIVDPGEETDRDRILAELDGLSLRESLPLRMRGAVERENFPVFEDWQELVTRALAQIRSGQFSKVVMARRATLHFDRAPEPCALLARLSAGGASASFLFQFDPDHVFFGHTPELLYSRSGGILSSVALAGTRPRGVDAAENTRFERELLSSQKDLREHQLVVRGLVDVFRCVCSRYGMDEGMRVLRLPRQQHLATFLSGELSGRVTDAELCAAFHPTPAVGGFPRDAAMMFLRNHELFDRGWFASPVGFLEQSRSEFMTAIRSALLDGSNLHLYSGAGIVEGSVPLWEWEETEHKISHYLDVINAC